MKQCNILLYCDKKEYYSTGVQVHRFNGYWDTSHNKNQYIKSFDGENFVLTYELTEAFLFEDDEKCNACMEAMVKNGAVTIAVWNYESDSRLVNAINNDDFAFYRSYMDNESYHNKLLSLREHPSAQAVHYPNTHWPENNNLQPSLMNDTVAGWLEKHMGGAEVGEK